MGPTEEECCLQHEVVFLNIDKKCQEVREAADKRLVTDASVALVNVKEAKRALKERANRLLMLCRVEDRNNAQDQLATTPPQYKF